MTAPPPGPPPEPAAGSPQDQPVATREPDYRFTLANERTFLAWMRTCLALLAAGVALDQFAPALGTPRLRDLTGILLAVLAGYSAFGGLWRWSWNQRAMSRGEHLRPGPLPAVLAVGLMVITVVVIVLLVRDLAS
jgi:putative membrane protein